MYEAIVKGENVLEPGLPESFNVMCKRAYEFGSWCDLQEPVVGAADDDQGSLTTAQQIVSQG